VRGVLLSTARSFDRPENGPRTRYNTAMRRTFYFATSLAMLSLLFVLPVWAQRRGGGGGSHVASHGGFAGHSSGGFHSGSLGRGSCIHLRIGNSFNRRGFGGRRGYYPYGYYGWYDDPLAYDGSQDQDSYAAYQVPYAAPSNPESGGLRNDVQALSGKIDRLQADVEARSRKPEQEPATALVFRDQHVEEVRNYAIADGTLWVLNEQAAKKIPLARLDIPATVKMNEDRGVDFQVPGPTFQLMIER